MLLVSKNPSISHILGWTYKSYEIPQNFNQVIKFTIINYTTQRACWVNHYSTPNIIFITKRFKTSCCLIKMSVCYFVNARFPICIMKRLCQSQTWHLLFVLHSPIWNAFLSLITVTFLWKREKCIKIDQYWFFSVTYCYYLFP